MKIRFRSVLAGAATLAVTAGALLVGSTAAFAAVTPAWEPDANALGTISFYNAAGTAVTGGSLSDRPAAFYAAASGPGRTGDALAQLRAATPQPGVLPALWTTDPLGGATAYPNTTAPANIAALTVPVATGKATDLSLAEHIFLYPNTSTAAGYQNLYELRLYTSGPGQGAGNQYYRVDIEVSITGTDASGLATGTWSVIYPTPVTPTTTTITASPASPAPHGSTVTLTANVAPAAAGSVHFFDGATDLGVASYNAATGVATLAVNPADGAHSFSAQFTSTDAGFGNSSSSALAYSVNSPATATSTSLVAAPASPVTGDASGNASVALTATVTPSGVAGSVAFFDGATNLGVGTYTPGTGIATISATLNAAGSPHFLTATFTPASATYDPSTSAVVNYVVLPQNYGTAGIPLNATNNTAPYAGSLNLQVAGGTAVTLAQVDPNTAAGHPVQATDPTGHRRAWVFLGDLAGVAVQDSRPGQPGWTVTGQATDFVNGGTTIGANNLGWVPAKVAPSDAEGTITAGAAISPLLKSGTGTGLASPGGNLASAAIGSGLGTQNLGAALEFWIPDTSPTGTYSSTLTLTLVSP